MERGDVFMFDFKIVFLGAIQGLTEFLPVSSSAHLAFFQWLFDYQSMLGYDIILHMATLFALLIFFRKDIFILTLEWTRGLTKSEYRKSIGWIYSWTVLLGTVVTALIAMPLKGIVGKVIESPTIVAMGLFCTSLLLWYMGNINVRERKLSLKTGWLVGLTQGIAVMPGISRSGSTIFMGRLAGLSSEEAFRFSFLISIPSIAGATLLEIREMFKLGRVTLPPYWWIGALLAFLLGLCSLFVLQKFVMRGRFKCFSVYCLFLAFIMILLNVLR
jgi:undecaprenyl-diphosphatase